MSESVSYVVPGMSRADIRQLATQIRDLFGMKSPKIDLIRFMDIVISKIDEGYQLEVCPMDEMGDNHGLTVPAEKIVKIREDVYGRAEHGVPRDRFTLAHELGHYLLHREIGLARKIADHQVPSYQKSEWQANAFAGEFLVDHRQLCMSTTVAEIAVKFGVSMQVANIQLNEYRKAGLLQE